MQYSDHLNLEQLRRYVSAINARARSYKAPGTVDAAILRGIILDSGGVCGWCGSRIVDADFEIEHIISLRMGGSNQMENLACTCPDCNRQKGNQHPAKFAQMLTARGGTITPLVQRIIDQYDLEARVQRGLFDEPDTTPRRSLIQPLDEDHDEPPPYKW